MQRNIFVLGLDGPNLETLQDIKGMRQSRIHPLLTAEELTKSSEISMADLLHRAEQRLAAFDGSVDAIIGYWDFPVSSMIPLLCRKFDLISAPLEAVLKCEHKYWSRLEQQKVISEHPAFGLVRLEDEAPPSGVNYPLWIKPVKAFSSELAFEVHDVNDFRSALEQIREGIGRVGEPFDFVLDHVELPGEIADIGGQVCIAEESVSGMQVTVEGYHTGADVHVYGVVDSHTYPDSSSFLRYQYPSTLPADAQQRMADVSAKVIEHIGLTNVPFNIEYFWDAERDRLTLLEINPRQSQSHAILFEHVDGVPNHQCMVRLALGLPPDLPYREGPYDIAAKWFLRRFADGVATRVPTDDEVAEVEKLVPGCQVHVAVREGDVLSDLFAQDSYSYAIATVHIGASSEEELKDKYERCVDALPFEFDE